MLEARLRQAESHNLRVSNIHAALRSAARTANQCLVKQADEADELLDIYDRLEGLGMGHNRGELSDLIQQMKAQAEPLRGRRVLLGARGAKGYTASGGLGTMSLAEAARVGGPPLLTLHPSVMQRMQATGSKAVPLEPLHSFALVPRDLVDQVRQGAALQQQAMDAGMHGAQE